MRNKSVLVILMIAACLFYLDSMGCCEESEPEFVQEEITWEDLSEIENISSDAPQEYEESVPYKRPPMDQELSAEDLEPKVKEEYASQKPKQETQLQAAQEQAESQVGPESDIKKPLQAPRPKADTARTRRETRSVKNRTAEETPLSKEEEAWARANTIVGSEPGPNRDVFAITPERE